MTLETSRLQDAQDLTRPDRVVSQAHGQGVNRPEPCYKGAWREASHLPWAVARSRLTTG